jgi:hypothetical protein
MSPTLDAPAAYWGERAKGKEFLTWRASEEAWDGDPAPQRDLPRTEPLLGAVAAIVQQGSGILGNLIGEILRAVAARALFCEDRCSMVPVAPQRNFSYTGKRGERYCPSPWVGMSSYQA